MTKKHVPYSRDPDDLFHPGRDAVTDFFDPDFGRPIPSDAALCSEMARLAYVRHEEGPGLPRLQGFLHRGGFALVRTLDAGSTQGFVASRNEGEDPVTVVAFRGTEPDRPMDVLADVDIVPSPGAVGGRVHRGFANALHAVEVPLQAAILGAHGRIVLTGHSLGAAVALLAAGLVPPERRAATRLHTFGCPRTGDNEFVQSMTWLSHTRHAGACDLVSWIPPAFPPFPFVHHGTLHCIDRGGKSHEFGFGEEGDHQARALRAPCGVTASLLPALFARLIARTVPIDELSDHAPINYTSAIWGLR